MGKLATLEPEIKYSLDDLRRRVLESVAGNLERYITFHEKVEKQAEPGWPSFAQAMRIKAFLDHKRILVADDTGINGKTFTAVASKIMLDKETGRRNTAFIVAPNSGLINAWSQDEINRYAQKIRAPTQNAHTVSEYRDLQRFLDGEVRDVDFLICNWEKLSVREGDVRWDMINNAITQLSPNAFYFDECHNAKGSQSNRSKTVRKLTEYSLGKHLMLLSATPIPNRYHDLGMVFHMLDPDKYSDPNMLSYCPPEVIKELINRQVWFRLTREQMKEELGLPDLLNIEVPVELTQTEAEMYFHAWAECLHLGAGLTELRNILYDARLSKYGRGLGKDFIPSKMRALDELVDDLIEGGQKIIVKTHFVEGVVGPYTEMLTKYGNVLTMTGITSQEDRKKRVQLFRTSSDHNILLMSQVGEESMDMTTGETPCALIPLEPEMTPREYIQQTGRQYRRGQIGTVSHYTLLTQSKLLDSLMVENLDAIARLHGCKVPKKFKPRTIDADMYAMRKAKITIVDKIYGGENITKKEEAIYDVEATTMAAASTHFEGLIAPTQFKDISPFQMSILIQAHWRNIGEHQFLELTQTKGWKKWRNLYEQGWEGSSSEETLRIIGRIIAAEEKRLGYSPNVIDVGSGAAYLSRACNRSMTCLDIDPAFLENGKQVCERLGIKNQYVAALATNTGLAQSQADILVNSYMLFYLGEDGSRHEIEECVLESSRIMKTGGKFIISLPYTVEEKAVERFSINMISYGFEEEAYFTPKKLRLPNMKNGCHIVIYEKKQEARENRGLDLSFYGSKVRLIQ